MPGALQIGSRGARVVALQKALIGQGFRLPKWGADGQLGDETWRALLAFALQRGLPWPAGESEAGSVPQAVLDALAGGVALPPPPAGTTPAEVVDLTGLHALTQGRPGVRDPAGIDAVVLHQTACRLGSKPERYYAVACHVAVPADGRVLVVNPFLSYVFHANAANRFSVGIEIDGRFEGVAGRLSTLWGSRQGARPDPLGAAQIAGARAAVHFLVEEGRRLGAPISKLYAHRQFSATRQSDPGSAIWQAVAPWAESALGLTCPIDETLADGLPIPREWDPRGSVDYAGRKIG